MSDFYNAFGQFVSTQTIETFVNQADDKIQIDNTKILNNIKVLKVQIETGTLTKEQVITEIEKLNSLKENKDTSDQVKNEIESLVKDTVSKVDGIRLEGNMEIGGVMKSRGFYLTDGTKVNEVIRVVDKLAVPLDKEGHVTILPPKGKRVKATVHDLNIPKSGRITFGDKEDNDPYHLRKIGNTDNNHLRLTLNDNNNESLQIWGDSCKTDKCSVDGGTVKHVLDSNGNATHTGGMKVTGGRTHFKDVENRGRVRVGAAWGIPGFYSEDNQDIVVGVPRNRKVNLGTAGKFVEINGNGNIKVPGGAQVTGGRSHFKDAENKGRVRVGAAWGIPGFYSEDNQDIVVGVPSAKKVNLGTAGKFVEITGTGNMKVPGNVNTPLLSRIGGDWLRINQQTNSVGRVATYGGFSINDTRSKQGGLSVGSWTPPGQGNIIATGEIKAGQIKAGKICINNTCITEAQLKTMMTNQTADLAASIASNRKSIASNSGRITVNSSTMIDISHGYKKVGYMTMGGSGQIVKGGDYTYYGGYLMVLEKTGSFKLLKAKTPYQYPNMKPEWEFKSNRSPSENVRLYWDANHYGGAMVITYNGGVIWDAPRENGNSMYKDKRRRLLIIQGGAITLRNNRNSSIWEARKGLPANTGKSTRLPNNNDNT
uniref:Uncharacterized protein n=1 Tax=viral metagenome TaxID=1070528 RepID=A0A6C0IVF7_9ZZZZ